MGTRRGISTRIVRMGSKSRVPTRYRRRVPNAWRGRVRDRSIVGLIVTSLVALVIASQASADPLPTTSGPQLATPETAATTPGDDLRGIGSDGSDGVWFSENGDTQQTAYLTHYQPTAPGLTRVALKVLTNSSEYIQGIAPGPQGTEWFARFYDNEISHITSGGKLVTKKLPKKHFNPEPEYVVVDHEGNVWFTARGHGCSLGRLSPAGVFTEYGIGGDCEGHLTIGPDGNIWVASYTGNVVDEVSAATGAILARYPMDLPLSMATVGDNVWVSNGNGKSLMTAISPSGQTTEFELPAYRGIFDITAGPDDAVWFSEGLGPVSGFGGIGRLTANGELSETSIPGGGGAVGIAATNNAIYVTDQGQNNEGSLVRVPLSNMTAPGTASYVALGDSYSSGEGDPPYEAGTTPPQDPNLLNSGTFDHCHRSQQAYGPLVGGILDLGATIFKACSGAVTEDFFNENPNNEPEPAQLSWLEPSDQTVTFTIGGNDAGFVHIVEECVAGLRSTFPFVQKFGCSTDKSLQEETEQRLEALEGRSLAFTPPPEHRPIRSLKEVIEAVHTRAPAARIVVGGYPQLFGSKRKTYAPLPGVSPSGRVCLVGTTHETALLPPEPLLVDYFDAQWLNELAGELDSVIEASVEVAQHEGIPVSYAEPTAFSKHGLCDKAESWFHPVELDSTNVPEADSFHPTADGQRLGYEPAFAAKLK